MEKQDPSKTPDDGKKDKKKRRRAESGSDKSDGGRSPGPMKLFATGVEKMAKKISKVKKKLSPSKSGDDQPSASGEDQPSASGWHSGIVRLTPYTDSDFASDLRLYTGDSGSRMLGTQSETSLRQTLHDVLPAPSRSLALSPNPGVIVSDYSTPDDAAGTSDLYKQPRSRSGLASGTSPKGSSGVSTGSSSERVYESIWIDSAGTSDLTKQPHSRSGRASGTSPKGSGGVSTGSSSEHVYENVRIGAQDFPSAGSRGTASRASSASSDFQSVFLQTGGTASSALGLSSGSSSGLSVRSKVRPPVDSRCRSPHYVTESTICNSKCCVDYISCRRHPKTNCTDFTRDCQFCTDYCPDHCPSHCIATCSVHCLGHRSVDDTRISCSVIPFRNS